MRSASFALAGLALVLMLAAAPPASACHTPPVPSTSNCENVGGLPFGVVPYATDCLGDVAGVYNVACNYAIETTYEVAFGCPPTNNLACALG